MNVQYREYQRVLRLVSQRELRAALAGGRTWREFVRWAEGVLDAPWEQIRADLDTLHQLEGGVR